jgi:hypothetical protein
MDFSQLCRIMVLTSAAFYSPGHRYARPPSLRKRKEGDCSVGDFTHPAIASPGHPLFASEKRGIAVLVILLTRPSLHPATGSSQAKRREFQSRRLASPCLLVERGPGGELHHHFTHPAIASPGHPLFASEKRGIAVLVILLTRPSLRPATGSSQAKRREFQSRRLASPSLPVERGTGGELHHRFTHPAIAAPGHRLFASEKKEIAKSPPRLPLSTCREGAGGCELHRRFTHPAIATPGHGLFASEKRGLDVVY